MNATATLPRPLLQEQDWHRPYAESHQIDAMTWIEEPPTLLVRFKARGGGPMAVYAYPQATQEEMADLLAAESCGAAFNVWKRGESAQSYYKLSEEQLRTLILPRHDVQTDVQTQPPAPVQEAPAPARLDTAAWVGAIMARVPGYVTRRADLMKTTASITAVESDETCELALRYAADLSAERKAVEAHFEPYCGAAHELHKRMVAARYTLGKTLAVEMERLKKLALDYEDKKLADRIAEENRLEREELEKVKLERERIEREAQERATALESEGRAEEALETIERAVVEAAAVTAAPIVLPPPSGSPIGASGAIRRKTYEPIFGDLLALVKAAAANPQAFLPYLSFNEKVIGAAVRAQGPACDIPGVRVAEKNALSVKASK